METFVKTTVCLILCIAAGLYKVQATHVEVEESEPAVCDEFCVVPIPTQDGTVTKILYKGEKMIHEENPCITYTCQPPEDGSEGKSITIVEHEICETITSCPDGQSPYYPPGECCLGCPYFFTEPSSPSGNKGETSDVPEITPGDSFSEWSTWTPCPVTCGGGRRMRERECLTHGKVLVNCVGPLREIEDCNTHHCPVHGGWSNWTAWTDCSLTCGPGGVETRERSCTNPEPAHGGNDCVGDEVQTRTCNKGHCPVDCQWQEWQEWEPCSADCEGGVQVRRRHKIPELYGGLKCVGPEYEQRTCNTHRCPIHGGWSLWSEWTECTVTCGEGTQNRHRTCNNPTPQFGGNNCTGVAREQQVCQFPPCPVHCEWGEWSEWSECSATCEGGTMSRSRQTTVDALHGGDECQGENYESMVCNEQDCPNPCIPVNPCFEDVECTRLSDTEFECGSCPKWAQGDGIHCEPVDECQLASPCYPGVVCKDFDHGFSCSACPDGMEGSAPAGIGLVEAAASKQMCTDIDECTEGLHQCDELRPCINVERSYACGPCPEGYVDNGDFECTLVNPCAAGVHDCAQLNYCFNTEPGEFECKCPKSFIGNGKECSPDTDLDGIPDFALTVGCSQEKCFADNCRNIPNSRQNDTDGDGIGDACDPDIDNDGIPNEDDNCPYKANPEQTDDDLDGIGSACDNCVNSPNTDQSDIDGDGFGDECDSDTDNDGFVNTKDKCPHIYNMDQMDSDGDSVGDECDNCRYARNNNQNDEDQNGVGDACDKGGDYDNDGIVNQADNCVMIFNTDQANHHLDLYGDACDNDDDKDGIWDHQDNCQFVANPDQTDSNGNGIGDACENDHDGDGFDNEVDLFPEDYRVATTDFKTRHVKVNLAKSNNPPVWMLVDEGNEVIQEVSSDPGLLLSKDFLHSYRFTGTIFVGDSGVDDGYIGLALNFQSNKRFIVVSWSKGEGKYKSTSPFTAIRKPGIQVKVVKSLSGPGAKLRNALWHTDSTPDEVQTTWKNSIPWEHQMAYRWDLTYSEVVDCMRVKVYNANNMIADTECLCGMGIQGGKLGFYAFNQRQVIWSKMKYEAFSGENQCSI